MPGMLLTTWCHLSSCSPPSLPPSFCQSLHRLRPFIGTWRCTSVDGGIHFGCQSQQGSGQWVQTCQYLDYPDEWLLSLCLSVSLGFQHFMSEGGSLLFFICFLLCCALCVCVCVFMHCIMLQLTINKLEKLAWICNSTVCLFHSYVKFCNHLHWPWKEYYCLWSYPRIIVCNAWWWCLLFLISGFYNVFYVCMQVHNHMHPLSLTHIYAHTHKHIVKMWTKSKWTLQSVRTWQLFLQLSAFTLYLHRLLSSSLTHWRNET